MGDLVDVLPKDLITSQRQNDINDYIEDGTHKVNTLSLDIGGTEVITESRSISGIVNVTATGDGSFRDLTVTRKAYPDNITFTTSAADLDVNKEYITFNLTDTGGNGFYGIYMENYSSGGGYAQPLYIYSEGQTGGTAPIVPVWVDTRLTGTFSGDHFGVRITHTDNSTEGASDEAIGLEITMNKNQDNNRTTDAIRLYADGTETIRNGILFASGNFINGIDLSAATLTNAIKMGNSQTLYDGTNSLTVSNAVTAYTYSQVGHLPLAGGTMSGELDMGANSISNVTNITAAGTITLGSTTLTEQNLIDLLALI